jgi:hypothetical protein
MNKLEALINAEDAGANHRKFNAIKETILQRANLEIEDQKHQHESEGKAIADFKNEHPLLSKISALINIFKEKYDNFHKKQEAEQKDNLEKRQQIIEKLKNLYSNSNANTNLFRAIREIKEEWSSAGQVPKSEFKNLTIIIFPFESILSNVRLKQGIQRARICTQPRKKKPNYCKSERITTRACNSKSTK